MTSCVEVTVARPAERYDRTPAFRKVNTMRESHRNRMLYTSPPNPT